MSFNPFRDEDGRNIKISYVCLTPHQKKVFILYMKGMSKSQIAKKIGTTVSNISSTVKKSVDKLCQYYYNLDTYRMLVRRGGLTNTEKMVFKLWKISGKTNKEISKRLHTKVPTIEWHKANIRKKINVEELDKAGRNYSVNDDCPEYNSCDISRYLLKKTTKKKTV